MLTIPSAVEEALKNGAQKNFRVHFPNGERADITNDNIVSESVSFTESICSQSELKFGLAEASVLEFETVGVENIRGAEIEASVEVEYEEEVDLTPYSDGESKSGDEYTYTVEGENIIFRGYSYGSNFILQEAFELDPSKTYRLSGCPAGGSIIGYSLRANGNSLYFVFDDNDYALITGESSLQIWIYVNYSGELVFTPKLVEIGSSYSIPYGKFVVDECPRQTNLEHRKITAYSRGISAENWNAIERAKRNTEISTKLDYTYNPLYASIASAGAEGRISVFEYGSFSEGAFDNSYSEDIDDSTSIEFEFYGDLEYYDKDKLLYFEADVVPFAEIEAEIRQVCASFTESKIKQIINSVRYVYENPLSVSIEEYDSSGSSGVTSSLYTDKEHLTKGSYVYPYMTHPNASEKGRIYGMFSSFEINTINHVFYVRRNLESAYATYETAVWLPATTLKRTKVGTNRYICSAVEEYSANDCLIASLELCGLFGRRNRNGNFDLVSLNNNFIEEPVYEIQKSEYSSFWYEEQPTLPYGKLCANYLVNGEEFYYEVFCTNEYPSITYDFSENILIKNGNFAVANDVMYLLMHLMTHIGYIQYIASDISSIGLPFLEAGDVIDVVAADDNLVRTFVEKRTISGVQALFDDISSEDTRNTYISGGSSSGGSSGGGGGSPSPVVVNDSTITIEQGNFSDSFTLNQSSNKTISLPEPTIPTVNDGTLTIKQDGTTLGTFSANQSGNTTVNITGGGGGGGTTTLESLWTNSSPSSSFTAKTVSLDLQNYDFLIIGIRFKTSTDNYANVIVKTDGTSVVEAFLASSNRYRRSISANSSGITFGGGEKASPSATSYSSDNTCYIPIYVYGFHKITGANNFIDLTANIVNNSATITDSTIGMTTDFQFFTNVPGEPSPSYVNVSGNTMQLSWISTTATVVKVRCWL